VLGLTGSPATFASTRLEDGRLHVAFGLDDETVDRACIASAWDMLAAALAGQPTDAAATLARLIRLGNDDRLGPSTRGLLAAAARRGVPTSRVQPGYSVIRYGWGSRQRRSWTTQTDRTSAIGAEIAGNKQLAREILRRAGVPVAPGRVATSADDAWEAAQELGTPVVVKPRDANRGRGVSTGLTTREQVAAAFELAARVRLPEPADVLVERQIDGAEHRLLVVDGRMIAAYRSDPPTVVGDGRRSIAELVHELNRDPRRGTEWRARLATVLLDEQARLFLAARGLSPDSIPDVGQRVTVRRDAGQCVDVTDLVHPDVAARAVEAAAIVGIDVAGLDVIALDISRPLEAQRGAIIEVNTGPCLTGHLEPDIGTPRPVADAILDALMPPGDDGRIPVVAVCGAGDRAAVARRLADRLAARGLRVGLAAGHLRPPERPPARGVVTEAPDPEFLLRHAQIDALVLDASAADVRARGLGVDRCALAVWTGVSDPDEDRVRTLISQCVGPNASVTSDCDDTLHERLARLLDGPTPVRGEALERLPRPRADRDHQSIPTRVDARPAIR
jgi:cyanophycin synthetase